MFMLNAIRLLFGKEIKLNSEPVMIVNSPEPMRRYAREEVEKALIDLLDSLRFDLQTAKSVEEIERIVPILDKVVAILNANFQGVIIHQNHI